MSAHPVTPAVRRSQFGVIGLGVMGQNLALNLADHGRNVALWNLESEWVDRFLQQNGQQRFVGTKTLEDFVQALEPPRQMLMMIKAGEPVDEMLAKLRPYLAPGDIVIDGGNSFYRDTQRREAEMRDRGVHFVGMGVSGGEEGARHGPSLMPGGRREAYDQLEAALEAIAAKTDSGPCVTYVGPDGAGHFVKMVHNGIEYGDMQLIAEAYDIFRKGLGLSSAQLEETFAEWGRGSLESYLIEITAQIFTVADPESGKPLLEMVLDKAGQKGTGKWTAQVALDLGISIPTIEAALDARLLSARKEERAAAAAALGHGQRRYDADKKELISAVHDALFASKVCCYAQGMSLIRAGSDQHAWNISLREMARIWKGGCIIRARLLDAIMGAFEQQPELASLLLDSELGGAVRKAERGWRHTVETAIRLAIPAPAFSASLAYYDAYRSANLPQNLIQAQRDYFGAHTYQRSDKPEGGFVHTDWQKLAKPGGTA